LTSRAKTQESAIRIALLHLAPLTGELDYNRRLIEAGIEQAAEAGAEWIVTPELAVCGYSFNELIGTDWIKVQPDAWVSTLCCKTAEQNLSLVLSHPERDPRSGKLFNSVLIIANGVIVGRHYKINALREGSESWSSPGEQVQPITLPGRTKVGVLICGDAFSPGIASSLRNRGAQILISSAAWAPGFHGPNGEWEQCSRLTGLSLLVCNRTGRDRHLDFSGAESAIIHEGKRFFSFSSPRSTVVLVDWHPHSSPAPFSSPRTLVLSLA
jgi:predicted amidohydrolase